MLHVFDIDGTLLDSMPMWNRLPLELLGRHGIHIEAGSEEAVRIFQKLDPITSEQGAAWISETYLPDMSPEEVYLRPPLKDWAFRAGLKRSTQHLRSATTRSARWPFQKSPKEQASSRKR